MELKKRIPVSHGITQIKREVTVNWDYLRHETELRRHP